MIELEINLLGSVWIENYTDFDDANIRWNSLIENGISVFYSTNFDPQIICE